MTIDDLGLGIAAMGSEDSSTPTEALARPRFQFSLRELLGIVALTGVSLLVVGPAIMRWFGAARYYWPPRAEYFGEDSLAPALLVAGATCVGAFVGLLCAYRFGFARWRRAACLLAGVLIVWCGFISVAEPVQRGANHAAAAAACMTFAEAEEIFHRVDYGGDGVLCYAPTLHDLYETKPGAKDLQLIPREFAAAEVVDGHATTWKGYVFRVLKAQGPAAPHGARSYLMRLPDRGEYMSLGYALVACPAVYGESGRDLFIINCNEVIYHRDAGEKTREVFEQMTEFNPDPKEGWVPAE